MCLCRQDLYQRCEKMRPTLFRLASDTEDNDEALGESSSFFIQVFVVWTFSSLDQKVLTAEGFLLWEQKCKYRKEILRIG